MSNATHNALLTTTSAVTSAYAVALLLAPAATLSLFDLGSAESGVWTARLLGAGMLGVAALAFFARRIDNMDARRAIDGGFLVATSISTAVAMWAMYLQVMNPLGWINAAIYGAFAVSFFYFIAGEDRLDVSEGVHAS